MIESHNLSSRNRYVTLRDSHGCLWHAQITQPFKTISVTYVIFVQGPSLNSAAVLDLKNWTNKWNLMYWTVKRRMENGDGAENGAIQPKSDPSGPSGCRLTDAQIPHSWPKNFCCPSCARRWRTTLPRASPPCPRSRATMSAVPSAAAPRGDRRGARGRGGDDLQQGINSITLPKWLPKILPSFETCLNFRFLKFF